MDDKKIRYISIQNLLLDLDNPRLPEDISEKTNQKEVFEHIIGQYDIDELVQAIGENDYFAGEPLIVIPSQKSSKEFIVVEGNRRLTALKVLNEPKLIPKNYINLAKKAQEAKHRPMEIPCVVFDDREKILPYLGLRHVSGVKSWDLIAKARYIKKLFDKTDNSLNINERVLSVTRSMGSKSNYIRRNLLTLYIYNIIKNQDFFELNEVNEKTFQSYVFYRAISKPDVKKFINIPYEFQLDFAEKINMDNLKLIVKVICERDERGRTILGNPDHLDDLADIVTEPKALEKLRKSSSIKEALKETNTVQKEFIENLYLADNSLDDAQSNVQEIPNSSINNKKETKDVIRFIDKRLNTIKKELKTNQGIECE